MDYFDLKEISNELKNQRLKVAMAEEKSISLEQNISGIPSGGTNLNKISVVVEQTEEERKKLDMLEHKLRDEIAIIPNEYFREIIECKLLHNWSWTKIAMKIGNNNTGDGIRMSCTRYKW